MVSSKHDQQPPSNSTTNPEIPHNATAVFLGIVMFLLNLSFVMIYSLSAAYVEEMKRSQTYLGFLEGVFEFISQMLKFSSGFIIDLIRRRRLLVLLGCSVIFVGRSFVGMANKFIYYFLGRGIDRIGNGLYAIPRDALVAATAPKSQRAQKIGMVRSLGQIGSVLGTLIAVFLMKYLNFRIQDVFAIATIPPFFVLLIILFKIKEVPFEKKDEKKDRKFHIFQLSHLGSTFFLLMIVNFIFMMGRCNEVFMNAYAQKTFQITKENVPYVTMIFNISWAFFSYPVGIISDKFGRWKVLACGILALVISDLFFYGANSLFTFFLGVIFWGIQTGITTNTFIALIVDTVKPNLRGTAFGFYYLINAICLFCADYFGGKITDCFGSHAYMYLTSSFFGALSLIILLFMIRYISKEPRHIEESI